MLLRLVNENLGYDGEVVLRNDCGEWQRSNPIQHDDFIRYPALRRRYWARTMAGWAYVAEARPNAAHCALVELERPGALYRSFGQLPEGVFVVAWPVNWKRDVIERDLNRGEIISRSLLPGQAPILKTVTLTEIGTLIEIMRPE